MNFADRQGSMACSSTSVGLCGMLGLAPADGTAGADRGVARDPDPLDVRLRLAQRADRTRRIPPAPRAAPKLAALITAVGFSFILQNVGLLWRGGAPQSVNDLIHSQQDGVQALGGADRAQLHPRLRGDDPARVRDDLVHQLYLPRPRDARDRAGSRSRPPDGHRRQPHDLDDVLNLVACSPAPPGSSTRCTRRTSGTSRGSRPG